MGISYGVIVGISIFSGLFVLVSSVVGLVGVILPHLGCLYAHLVLFYIGTILNWMPFHQYYYFFLPIITLVSLVFLLKELREAQLTENISLLPTQYYLIPSLAPSPMNSLRPLEQDVASQYTQSS